MSLKRKDLEDLLEKHGFNNQNKYFLNITDLYEKTLRLEEMEKEPKKVITFEKTELDKYLLNDKSSNLLYFYSLKRPSYYKDKSLRELQEALKKSTEILSGYKDAIKMLQNMIVNLFQEELLLTPKKVKKQEITQKKKLTIIILWNFTIII